MFQETELNSEEEKEEEAVEDKMFESQVRKALQPWHPWLAILHVQRQRVSSYF